MDWQVMIEDKDLLNEDMLDVLNPFNGEVIGKVLNANKSQVHEVLNRTFQFHCNLLAKEREEILLKAALYIEKHKNIARITLPLWLYVSITGILVYVMLYI